MVTISCLGYYTPAGSSTARSFPLAKENLHFHMLNLESHGFIIMLEGKHEAFILQSPQKPGSDLLILHFNLPQKHISAPSVFASREYQNQPSSEGF